MVSRLLSCPGVVITSETHVPVFEITDHTYTLSLSVSLVDQIASVNISTRHSGWTDVILCLMKATKENISIQSNTRSSKLL